MTKQDVHTANGEPSPISKLCDDKTQAISLENHWCNKIHNPSKMRSKIQAQIRCNKTLNSKKNKIQNPSTGKQVKKQLGKRA
jgi:hypothetical protein